MSWLPVDLRGDYDGPDPLNVDDPYDGDWDDGV